MRQRKKFKVKLVDYGIANRFPNGLIEIHRKLTELKYTPLFNEILEHEKKHTDGGYTLQDFKLDLKGFKNKKLYWQFILFTPSAWNQFFPLYRSKFTKGIYFDVSVFILWLLTILIIALIFIRLTGNL